MGAVIVYAGNGRNDTANKQTQNQFTDQNNDGICDEEYDIEYDGWDFLPLKDNGKIPLKNQIDTKQAPMKFILIISTLLLTAIIVNNMKQKKT